MESVKLVAQKTIEKLPKDSTWEDVFYELYVVKKIEEGLIAEKEGKTKTHDEVKQMFSR
ncbi:MAG: hypothetical protein IIB44_12430 [Candidatus Marinimicrobia bacterium]|nr:hypothetical protein [Candidatus Neomarinimicrobiota bacterium]